MVAWTLIPDDGGMRVEMVHDGLAAHDAMSPGRGKVLDATAPLTAEASGIHQPQTS